MVPRESRRNRAGAIASDAPKPEWPAIAPVVVSAPCHCREHTEGRAERDPHAAEPWVRCCERHGVIEIHDPRLLRPDRAAFCRALVEAAVARFGARQAEVRMESSTCLLEFEPGRFDRAELAGRAASAVRAATPSVRDGAGNRADAGAVGGILRASATDVMLSPRAPRGASSDVARSAGRPIPSSSGSRRLADLAKAGAYFSLAVGGLVLPGIPTLPFLVLTGRHAARAFPGIERLLRGHSWCAALLAEVEIPSDPTPDRRPPWRTIGLAVLFTAGSLILHPPLPIVLGLELGLIVFLGRRELDRSASRVLGPIFA